MTTNVYDSISGVLTTDSRWSMNFGDRIVFVDDVRFEKLECYGNFAFMFAGKGIAIQVWKDWIRSDPNNKASRPSHEGMSVCVVDVAQNVARFHARQDIVKDGGYFAGSGSIHAATCWATNKSATKAIETAKARDFYTGGEVKYFELGSRKHNLYQVTNKVTIDMVTSAILDRGNVMKIAQGQGVVPPFQKLPDLLAANDAEAMELKNKLVSGEIGPEAPCDGMLNEWTQAEKDELDDVLADVFGWSK